MSDGPKRMLEGLGEGSEDALLGKMLRSAQEDLPDAAMLSRIEAKLPSGGPTPPSGPTGPAGSTGGAAGAALSNTGLWMKLAGFLFATVAVIAIATRYAPSSAPEPAAEPVLEYGPPWAGPEATGSASEPAPEINEPTAKKPSPKKPNPRKPKPERQTRRTERRAPPQQNGPAELRLIQAAQAALVKGEHARALVLTEKHRAEHPSGAFVQEREVIAISALLRSDRREEAKRRASAFEGEFPRSAHLRRLKVLLQKP